MNQIVSSTGEMLSNTFKGPNGEWKLVGTESIGKRGIDCIDTFKNKNTNQYTEFSRDKLYNLAEQGKIFL